MKVGFTLPRKAVLRYFAEWAVALALCIPIANYLRGGSSHDLIGPFVCALFLLCFLGLLLTRYQYVHLAEDGFYGRPKSGRGLVHIAWSEPLSKEQASRKGLKGQVFQSYGSQKALFIPQAILESPAFRDSLEQFAPKNHVLLAAEV